VTVDDGRPLAATRGERRLEAPHRRGGARPRIIERVAVLGYRTAAWIFGVLPAGPTGTLMGWVAQLSYLLWPTKRRWSNRNFGHVLGVDPDHPEVRRLALQAYRHYGRYLVDLMRLPSRPRAELHDAVVPIDPAVAHQERAAVPGGGGLILTVGHVGNLEATAGAFAHLGLPISVVADDSSFPELFEHLRRQRREWGVELIPWRNLREIFGVLRRRELLGLVVDWGYRSDGIPVQLFGSWTALPAGPATLAAKTGSRILPIILASRHDDDRLEVTWTEPIDVRSSEPAELQRATQAIADALAATIEPAPERWYSFKPMWPETAEEAAHLERRAARMRAGLPDPGPT
jgi:KDO2-lipid IV(A) lauroyltransferase